MLLSLNAIITRKITRNRVLQKSFAGVALPQTPLMKLTTLPRLVSWDRINSHPTTLSTITSRPMPLSDTVYVAYICFVGVLLDLFFVPRPTGSLPLNPTGRLLFSRPLCRLDPCSCRSVYAYLLSSTRQRFAVFRLSVKQVTSQADKTCVSQVTSGSTTAILSM